MPVDHRGKEVEDIGEDGEGGNKEGEDKRQFFEDLLSFLEGELETLAKTNEASEADIKKLQIALERKRKVNEENKIKFGDDPENCDLCLEQ